MDKTINSFIKELKNINAKYRKLPLVIFAPNGLEFSPKIKMKLDGDGHPLCGNKVEKIVISWE